MNAAGHPEQLQPGDSIEVPSGMTGQLYQLVFSEEGTARDVWASHYGDGGMESNETPALVPWKSKVVGLTYTNKNNSSDLDIQIYSVAWTDNNSPTNLDFTWDINNARNCRKTTFSTDIIFDAGDKLSVYFDDKGTDAKQVVFIIYLQVLEDNTDDECRTYSGNVSLGGGTSGSS